MARSLNPGTTYRNEIEMPATVTTPGWDGPLGERTLPNAWRGKILSLFPAEMLHI
jgi:hypothetical protein